MSIEKNKAIYHRFMEEVVSKGDMRVADELLADKVIEHENLPADLPGNGEGIRQLFILLRLAFPDLTATIEDLIAEDDKVAARVTLRGTHEGDFPGIPATGRKIAYDALDISRIVNGKIVEHWGIPDYMSLFQQLGVLSSADLTGKAER